MADFDPTPTPRVDLEELVAEGRRLEEALRKLRVSLVAGGWCFWCEAEEKTSRPHDADCPVLTIDAALARPHLEEPHA